MFRKGVSLGARSDGRVKGTVEAERRAPPCPQDPPHLLSSGLPVAPGRARQALSDLWPHPWVPWSSGQRGAPAVAAVVLHRRACRHHGVCPQEGLLPLLALYVGPALPAPSDLLTCGVCRWSCSWLVPADRPGPSSSGENPLYSCSRGDRSLLELCVVPAGFSGRYPGVSVPLPRADLLQNGLVGSSCSPRDSQESSPTPQPEGPRHLHRIPRLSEAPWEVP